MEVIVILIACIFIIIVKFFNNNSVEGEFFLKSWKNTHKFERGAVAASFILFIGISLLKGREEASLYIAKVLIVLMESDATAIFQFGIIAFILEWKSQISKNE